MGKKTEWNETRLLAPLERWLQIHLEDLYDNTVAPRLLEKEKRIDELEKRIAALEKKGVRKGLKRRTNK